MISDILSDAIEEIERYQKDYGEVYDPIKDEIERVKAAMKALRIGLTKESKLTEKRGDHGANQKSKARAAPIRTPLSDGPVANGTFLEENPSKERKSCKGTLEPRWGIPGSDTEGGNSHAAR